MGEVEELYERLQRLVKTNAVVNFYGGCVDDRVDAEILDDFYIFLVEKYEEWPDWVNAYIQVYSWEYQAFYEGLITYYTNFYQHTDYESIQRTAQYLTEAGYEEVAKVYNKTMFDGRKYHNEYEQWPEEIWKLVRQAEQWIGDNEKTIMDCCIDILMRHKEELLHEEA